MKQTMNIKKKRKTVTTAKTKIKSKKNPSITKPYINIHIHKTKPYIQIQKKNLPKFPCVGLKMRKK